MAKEYTIKDVIKATYEELKGIVIPASIGSSGLINLSMPIARAMSNLEICMQAIEDEQKKDEEKETNTPEDEPSDGEESEG